MIIKVKKHITRKKGKEYTTYYIALPKHVVESLGITDTAKLEIKTIDGETAIVIKKYSA